MSKKISINSIITRSNRMTTGKYSTKVRQLSEGSSITSPYEYLKPLMNNVKVSESNFRYALAVVKESKNPMQVTNMLVRDILSGIEDPQKAYRVLESFELSDDCVDAIRESIDDQVVCDRIINNYEKLTTRFNFDNLAKQSVLNRNYTGTIREMCNLIDTYDSVTSLAKYNIALECIFYSLRKNKSAVPKTTVAETVTEYFLLRDNEISDSMYKQYQESLATNPLYYDLVIEGVGLDECPIVKAFMLNEANEFRTQLENCLDSCASDEVKNIVKQVYDISTEKAAAVYMEYVYNFITTNDNISPYDKGVLYKSVDYIPKITPVSHTFVNLQKTKRFDMEDFNKCVSTVDGLTVKDTGVVSEKQWSPNDLLNSFREGTFAKSSDIKELINKFKADQDKSGSKFKTMITKFYAKSPESIIDDLPSVFSVIRTVFLFGTATVTPIGPVMAAVLGLVNWFISKSINLKNTKEILTCFKNERKLIKEKIENCDDSAKKAELNKYLDNLEACINKVEEYKMSITDDYDDDEDGDDDLGDLGLDLDFDDFDFSESTEENLNMGTIALSELFSAMDYLQVSNIALEQVNIKDLVVKLSENHMLTEADPIIRGSSLNTQAYHKALATINKEAIKETNYRIATESSLLLNKQQVADSTPAITSLLMECTCNQTILAINEKFDLNNVKLALQGAKAKLKDLNTKQKSLWQSLDAAGSSMVNSIEKSLTSDRREAIIKGNIIPSFSKMCKYVLSIAAGGGVSLLLGHGALVGALITALGQFGVNKALNDREKKFLVDEIDTEIRVVEKQIDIAQNDQDMNQYRFLLNYQKKLVREQQRIKYGMKVKGRDIPASVPMMRNNN